MANASVEGSAVGKKLVELRVVDLRAELENRGLEKNGVKAVLIERLEKALQEEGKNPDEFLFEESESTPKKASGRQSSRLQEKDQTKDDDEEDYEDEDAEGENNETSEIAKGAEKEKDTLEEKPVNQQNLSKNSADDHERIGKKVQDNVTKDATLKSERERKSDESDSSTNSSPVKSGKDDRTENHSAAKNVATVVQSQAALGESKVPIKKDGNSGDSAAPPQSSSSSADSSKIEEKMDTSSNPQARKSEDVEGNGAKIVSQSTSEIQLDMSEIASPSPTSVSSVAPLTSKDAVDMDTSINQQNEESESLVVHVDDTQNDLDADLLASRSEGKTTKIEAGQTGGKIDVKKPESTPEAGDKGKTEMKTEKKGDEKKDDKDVKLKSSSTKVKIIKNVKGVNQNSRNLWVSGLSSSTRATDLKGLFTKYGKVVGAKVVTNARSPGARCYGFVTMSSADEASKCIQHLHRTELHGRMISVERAKNEPGTQNIKKMEVKPNADKKIVDSKKDEKKEGEKKEAEKKDGEKKDDKKDSRRDKKPDEKKDTRKIDEKRRGSHKVTDKSRVVVMDKEKGEPVISVKRTGDKDADSKDKEKDKLVHASGDGKEKHVSRVQTQSVSAASTAGTVSTPAPKGKARENKKDILSFDQIKEERERERLRQRERRLREEERRRIRELERARQRQRDVQRRQNEEAFRLEREREKIRLERERLERERLETERLRLERERLEREREREEQRRLELLRLEEQQRRAIKRPYDGRDESYWNEPKRPSVGGVRYDYSHSHDNRYTDFDHRDQGRYSDRNMNSNELYERRVERYDRRDGRSLESGRFDDRKGRDMGRREVGPVHNVRDRDEKRPDDRNRPEERFDRRDVGPGRDHSRDRSHEPDRRDMGADRGRDSDRRNMSAHDRLGRVRNLTAVALVEQRQQWGTGVERNKMENWSHSHTNLETGNVNRPDRWIGSSASSQHERGGSGGNYSITSGNMVQNMGSNMYMNQQTQPPNMMVGGGNVGNRQQEPRFDAYKNMGGNMRRY